MNVKDLPIRVEVTDLQEVGDPQTILKRKIHSGSAAAWDFQIQFVDGQFTIVGDGNVFYNRKTAAET